MPQPPLNSRPILFTEIEQFGGAERAALALCRWLIVRDLKCHIVCYEDRCGLKSFADFPIEIVQLRPANNVKAKIDALREHFVSRPPSAPRPLLSGYQPDLHATLAGLRGFHNLMHDTPSLFDDRSAIGLKHRIRRIVSNKIVSIGLQSGGKTIVTSEFLRDECRRDFEVRAEIVRMGGFAGRPAITPGGDRDHLRLLSVCRIEANKRIDWLLKALAELNKTPVLPLTAPLSELVDWRFDLVGKGPLIGDLRTLAEQSGTGQRVHFHGFVPDADLEAIYARANLSLMPAVQGYGIPAIESLARGIPVFLHRQSGVSDILLDTPWATVMDGGEANTTATLAKCIAGVLRGSHLAVPLPKLPTEEAWAERVATLCNWLPTGAH